MTKRPGVAFDGNFRYNRGQTFSVTHFNKTLQIKKIFFYPIPATVATLCIAAYSSFFSTVQISKMATNKDKNPQQFHSEYWNLIKWWFGLQSYQFDENIYDLSKCKTYDLLHFFSLIHRPNLFLKNLRHTNWRDTCVRNR